LCETKIYHPNFDYEKKVCLNILRDNYTPAVHTQEIIQGSLRFFLIYVCIGLSFLFYEPGAYNPLNKEAAQLMAQNIEAFKAKIQTTFQGGNVDGFA
jgi:ubiquitin-conjugating enzyme E2 M